MVMTPDGPETVHTDLRRKEVPQNCISFIHEPCPACVTPLRAQSVVRPISLYRDLKESLSRRLHGVGSLSFDPYQQGVNHAVGYRWLRRQAPAKI